MRLGSRKAADLLDRILHTVIRTTETGIKALQFVVGLVVTAEAQARDGVLLAVIANDAEVRQGQGP